MRQNKEKYVSNAVYRGDKEYYLNETGVLRIDEDVDGEMNIFIDGKKITQ